MSEKHSFEETDIRERNMLEERNESKSTEALKKERMFFEVLCRDYTSVYYLDLEQDAAEVLKVAENANTADMIGTESRQKLPYSSEMKKYCEAYVVDSGKEEFLRVLSTENLMKELADSDRFIYRYQSNPNKAGHKYFEVQAVRITEEGYDNEIILAFHHIDDIITAEQKRQQEVEASLQREKANNEILEAISKIYYAIYEIDLERDTYCEVARDEKVKHFSGTQGCASWEMEKLCENVVVPEYKGRIMQFMNLGTLADRLADDDTTAEEYVARDGNWHTARFVVKRRNEQGKVTHVLYVTRLISDAKRREKNWIAIAQEANKASESKTVFLRRMSHDIRTPINGILGMLEMENRHRDDVEKLQECRNKIYSAVEYLQSIVNNVLDIGKVESGGFILEHRSFDLVDLLMKQLSVIGIQAAENGINFHGGKEMSTIRHRYLVGSPIHVNRVLMNLANNAIKYNHRGGDVTLYCTEISSDEDTAVYEFICSDTGLGMSKEFQKKAFEPFTQEGKESVSSYNGSGLGLSIVKEIIEQMNGTIRLESEEGVGSTFTVTIPFEIDHEAQRQEKHQIQPVKINVNGKKALLVEDNALNREIAQMLLEDEGLIIEFAENGKEAVEKFAASEPFTYDFVFMDITMPVMDGLEATRRIRAMERADAAEVPILAMTANAFQDDVQMSMEAGMNAHLTKPLEVDKIEEAMKNVMMNQE